MVIMSYTCESPELRTNGLSRHLIYITKRQTHDQRIQVFYIVKFFMTSHLKYSYAEIFDIESSSDYLCDQRKAHSARLLIEREMTPRVKKEVPHQSALHFREPHLKLEI